MRGRTPTLHCDAEDGLCGTWDVDNYAADVSAVNGVRVSPIERAPGWRSTDLLDYCPDHALLEGSE